MKKATRAAAVVLAMAIGTSGLQAQRGPGPDRNAPRGEGPAHLLRTVQATLDQARVLGLDETRVDALEQLRDEVLVAGDAVQATRTARRDGRRAEARARMQLREPLPADPDARARVQAERRETRQAQRAEMQATAREERARMAETMDPLVQRYEELVPPSQRPELRAVRGGRGAAAVPGGRDGRRGAAAREGRRIAPAARGPRNGAQMRRPDGPRSGCAAGSGGAGPRR